MGTDAMRWKEPTGIIARWVVLIGAIAIGVVCLVLVINDVHRVSGRNTGDFEHFYYAADAVAHRQDPYAAWTQGYIYPPLIAFLFQPLTLLGRDRAAAVMLLVNVAVTLVAVALAADEFLRRFAGSRSKSAVVLVMLLALLMNVDKVKSEWQMWQTDVFMLLLFVLGLRWARPPAGMGRGRARACGEHQVSAAVVPAVFAGPTSVGCCRVACCCFNRIRRVAGSEQRMDRQSSPLADGDWRAGSNGGAF